MNVTFLDQDADIPKVLDLLIQLRPQFTPQSLLAQIKKQRESGYQLVYVESEGRILGVAGFLEGEKLSWGKYIYIDDLVVDESSRNNGVGTLLLDWFKIRCKNQGFDQLHLDSGVQRFKAHRFYQREKFRISSHHFVTKSFK
ncbi:N-acetyltransferase [Enterovibrio nigricans]|uniref:Acetyltransferase (GNAT) family protein n=2 Tax=Enterovibrio nigricans TaxID=504469 RepID=A0A1T4VPF3_9GAMM|nr:GNAT family N-acetyltransferase [Enterovibrio nigricans]PKF48991.1 N-acetyltransferase [Enterovibrio nigricans]SKA66807.1 Acetyltransferase (GNAT) family protein [Enterovibrio nigricans DSM 22720]